MASESYRTHSPMWLFVSIIWINYYIYCRFSEMLAAGCEWLFNSVPGLILLEVYTGDQKIMGYKKPENIYASVKNEINNTHYRCDGDIFVEHLEVSFKNRITWVWFKIKIPEYFRKFNTQLSNFNYLLKYTKTSFHVRMFRLFKLTRIYFNWLMFEKNYTFLKVILLKTNVW